MIPGRLWRGGCSGFWSWMTPNVGDIKEKYVPYIRRLREAQNPWNQEALLEEMPDLATPAPPNGATGPGGDQPVPPQNLDTEEGKLSWAMKRHQGELRMFGGIWKKHSSGEIPKGADQQFKLSPEELLALDAGPTHSRVSGTTSTRSSTRPWRSERR